MKSLKKFWHSKNYIFILGFLCVVTSCAVSICTGSSGIKTGQLWAALFSGAENSLEKNILLYVRIPRTLACVAAGAGLSVSGAMLQQILSNKLASPGIIGVNAGAGLGVILCAVAGAASGWMFSLSAFTGSIIAIFIITTVAYRSKASKSTVILGGVAVNGILNAVSEAVAVINDNAAALNIEFRMGGFSNVSYIKLVPAMVIIFAALAVVISLANELDVLSMGDDVAQGLGMNVRRMKNIFLILAALLAGASVSFSGLLGFIGLIVPHFVRKIIGSDSKSLIIGSMLFGAVFLCCADIAARMIFAPYEIPVGIIMSLMGGPAFIIVLIKKRGGHSND